MFNSIKVQTLPPEQFREFQVLLAFHYVKDLVQKCVEYLQYDVELYQDKECKYKIDSQLSLQQEKLNNIIFAKRVHSISTSSIYPQVICWFKQNGIELNQAVVLTSDFTFEEVLDEAKQKNIIQSIPQTIKVTDYYNQTKILATLMEMQMCKLIDSQDIDHQLMIHFTNITNFPSQIQFQQQKLIPQTIFQINQTQPKSNIQIQPQQFNIQNFSLQTNPQALMQNQQPKQVQPIQNIDNQIKFQNSRISQNLLNLRNPQNTITNPNIPNSNGKQVQPSQNIDNQIKFQNSRLSPNLFNLEYPQNTITNPNIPNSNGTFLNFNSKQNQQQSQINNKQHFKGNETIQSLEDIALKSVEQMIILGKFSFQINQKGDYVTYQCSFPQISGYFLEIKGKKGTLKDEKMFKWENKFGVQIADNLGKGFVIKWKNNTYNSLIIYFL